MYELLGVKIGEIGGRFGSNPFQIWYYLEYLSIDYELVKDYDEFKSKVNLYSNNKYIIATWNDDSVHYGLHTYYFEACNSKKLITYNMEMKDCKVSKTKEEVLKTKLRFLCGYVVEE